MWIVFLIFAVTFFVFVTRVRPRRESGRHEDGRREDGTEVVELPPVPGSLEGALVAQLTGGAITRSQYTRAMAQLAARDEARHPLSVPPEVG
jgi:hypothetical protein